MRGEKGLLDFGIKRELIIVDDFEHKMVDICINRFYFMRGV
jgi:hypothetical protein